MSILRGKIQEWSGKRINWAGDEYQIDVVFHEVKWLGEHDPQYELRPDSIGHNASEHSYKCGHVDVLSSEDVEELNNYSTTPKTRDEWRREIELSLCPTCARERMNARMDANENASHLMNPGEHNAL